MKAFVFSFLIVFALTLLQWSPDRLFLNLSNLVNAASPTATPKSSSNAEIPLAKVGLGTEEEIKSDFKSLITTYLTRTASLQKKVAAIPTTTEQGKAAQKIATDALADATKAAEKCNNDPQSCSLSEVQRAYIAVKNDNRLAQLQLVLTGQTNDCVKADLGATPHLKAYGVAHPAPKYKPERLFLCPGTDGTLKWRVQTPQGKFERLACLYPSVAKTSATGSGNLAATDVPPVYEGADCGFDPSSGVVLEEPNKDKGDGTKTADSEKVITILKKYIDAVIAGSTEI